MLSLIVVGSRGSPLDYLLSFLRLRKASMSWTLWLRRLSLMYYRHQTGERTKPDVQLSFVNGAWVDLRFRLKPSFQKVVRCTDCATAQEVSFVN
jgi:serpin B